MTTDLCRGVGRQRTSQLAKDRELWKIFFAFLDNVFDFHVTGSSYVKRNIGVLQLPLLI